MTVNTMLRVDTGTAVSSREIGTTSSRLVYIPMATLYGIIRLEYAKKKVKCGCLDWVWAQGSDTPEMVPKHTLILGKGGLAETPRSCLPPTKHH